jgi:hypothetical protein
MRLHPHELIKAILKGWISSSGNGSVIKASLQNTCLALLLFYHVILQYGSSSKMPLDILASRITTQGSLLINSIHWHSMNTTEYTLKK